MTALIPVFIPKVVVTIDDRVFRGDREYVTVDTNGMTITDDLLDDLLEAVDYEAGTGFTVDQWLNETRTRVVLDREFDPDDRYYED